MSAKEKDPTLINSSYTVLFHGAVVVFAFLFADTFNAELHGFSLAVNILYGIGIFWFFYLLRQFNDENPVLLFILAFFSVSAILGVMSAIKGPLAAGEVPILGLSSLNQKLIYWGAQSTFIYASVLIFYGYVTYMCSVALASTLEFLYDRLIVRVLPGFLRRGLANIDRYVDATSSRFSADFFFMNQRKGVMATLVALSVFVGVYASLLWFG